MIERVIETSLGISFIALGIYLLVASPKLAHVEVSEECAYNAFSNASVMAPIGDRHHVELVRLYDEGLKRCQK